MKRASRPVVEAQGLAASMPPRTLQHVHTQAHPGTHTPSVLTQVKSAEWAMKGRVCVLGMGEGVLRIVQPEGGDELAPEGRGSVGVHEGPRERGRGGQASGLASEPMQSWKKLVQTSGAHSEPQR